MAALRCECTLNNCPLHCMPRGPVLRCTHINCVVRRTGKVPLPYAGVVLAGSRSQHLQPEDQRSRPAAVNDPEWQTLHSKMTA